MAEILFTDSRKQSYTGEDILEHLRQVGADDCDILFVHTDILFGTPAPGLGRKDYLQALFQVLLDLHVKTLIFPAFSYSFCNHEDYDVRSSRTSMGALIEYIRKQQGVRRSLDPILSLIAVGERTDLIEGDPGHQALGPGSGFDRLHQAGGVRFLFFGADFAEYFTYIHHIEKVLEVPYRYDQSFSGNITDYDGRSFPHVHSIHTACGGVTLKNFSVLKEELRAEGCLKMAPLGDLELTCVPEEDVYRFVTERIRRDPYSFVQPYTEEDLTHSYTFGKNGERVTHC